MLGVKITASASPSHKTLVRTAVVNKRELQLFKSSREAFHHYPHMSIFCFSGVELARLKITA